jgi:uncharacterized membrane protein YphA (DoxX/SURF4 family)
MADITTSDGTWESDDAEAGENVMPERTGFRGFITGPYPTLLSRLVLGGIFLIAGLAKVGVPAALRYAINQYSLPIPSFIIEIMAVGMPVLEVLLGVWILLGLFTRFSAVIAGILMVIFTIALTQAWIRGLIIDCGCFGGPQANPVGLAILGALGPVGDFLSKEYADPPTIIRDLVLLGMAVHLFFVRSIWSLDNLRARSAAREDAAQDLETDAPAEA